MKSLSSELLVSREVITRTIPRGFSRAYLRLITLLPIRRRDEGREKQPRRAAAKCGSDHIRLASFPSNAVRIECPRCGRDRSYRKDGKRGGAAFVPPLRRASKKGVGGAERLCLRFRVNNLLLAGERLRSYASCEKQKGKAMVSVVLFWGVGFTALGWLIFKIAERM